MNKKEQSNRGTDIYFLTKDTQVFGNMAYNPDTEYNRHNNFKTFMAGLQVLFR